MAVLIYQMGKVGSTSLENSIKDSLHIHTLYGNYPCPHFERHVHGDFKLLIKKFAVQPLRRNLYKLKGCNKIISLVREPAARNISMFFQDLPFWIADYVKHYDRETRESDLDWLWRVFENSFDHEYCLTWFDREIKRYTGIDVLSEQFNCRRGYQQYKRGRYELLLLRMEDMTQNRAVIEEFCQQKVELVSTNVGDEKWYGGVYKEFSNNYKIKVVEKYEKKYKSFRDKFGYGTDS